MLVNYKELMSNLRLLIFILTLPFTSFAESSCKRVITLAPSITEVFYSLNLIQSVVGVSDFDKYPPEVESIRKIGGLFQISTEQVLMLKPSLVVGLKEHRETLIKLHSKGINTSELEHRNIDGILDSIKVIGDLCEKSIDAVQLISSLKESVNDIRKNNKIAHKPRVLVVVDRDISAKKLSSLYASGNDGFYNELTEIAGGENVVTSKTVSLPTFSLEGILAMNPDVIIEIQSRAKDLVSESELLDTWSNYQQIKAVRNNKVHIIRDDYAEIPGPRFILLLNRFASILKSDESLYEVRS